MRKSKTIRIIFVLTLISMLFALCSCGEEEKFPQDDAPIDPQTLKLDLTSEVYAETFREGNDEIAAYAFSVPKLLLSDGNESDVCKVFNQRFSEIADEQTDLFKNTTYADAVSQYKSLSDGESWGDKLYFTEMNYTLSISGDYIGVSIDIIENDGERSLKTGYIALMFDSKLGKFITCEELTNDYQAMKADIADDLLDQILLDGLDETCYSGYEDKVRSLEGAEIHFTEDGAMIVFPKGTIGDLMYCLLSDYDMLDAHLNDYAASLLYEFYGVAG